MIPEGSARVAAAITEAAEAWGAEWQPEEAGGRLRLPVAAGLRRGVLSGRLTLTTSHELVFTVEDSRLVLHGPSVAMLALAAAGGVATVVGPFFVHRFPTILAIAPLAILLAVGGWFVVVANQRLLGVDDFLEFVEELATDPGEG